MHCNNIIGVFAASDLIALGAVAILIMLVAPKGVWGLIRGKAGHELFPLSRRVRGLTEKGN